MKKLATLTCMLIAVCLHLAAQIKPVAEGPVFDEPEKGYAKLLQMKDGSVMFFDLTFKSGINIRIYDASHKETVVTHIETDYGNIREGVVKGVFEINGNAVLLLSKWAGRSRALYRVIVEGTTGKLLEQQQLISMEKLGFGLGYGMVYGAIETPDFFVRKDPASDNYAVAVFNTGQSDRNRRIEMVMYGANNQETARAFYASPDGKFKFLRYLDMAVMGPDKAAVVAYAYNKGKGDAEESELLVASFSKGSPAMSVSKLGFPEHLKVYWGIARYSPASNKILLLAAAQEKDKQSSGAYDVRLAIIDPETFKMEKNLSVADNDGEIEKLMGEKVKLGMPQNLILHTDGGFTIMYEKMIRTTTERSGYTTLGPVSVVTYTSAGKPMEAYFVPKFHIITSTILNPFYLSEREGGAQELWLDNQYKSFTYVNGKTKNYLFLNDQIGNDERYNTGKTTWMKEVDVWDAFYCPLSPTIPIPQRQLLFGASDSKKVHNIAMFSISDYDAKNNLYVTIKLERDGRKTGMKVVWLPLE